MDNIINGGSTWEWKIAFAPDICCLRPGEDYIEAEWKDGSFNGEHSLLYRVRKEFIYLREDKACEWQSVVCDGNIVRISGLIPNTDYELKLIRSDDSSESAVRLATTGEVPGVVVCHHHKEDELYACSGRYLGSPSLVRLPSGALLCCNDIFGDGGLYSIGVIHRSDDNGKTWRFVTRVRPIFHTKLFLHKDRLYLLGVSRECGDVIIGRSDDEGYTWTAPVMLYKGAEFGVIGPQRASLPVVSYKGRLYTSMVIGDHRNKAFMPGAMSIDENADLLDPAAWKFTREFVKYDYSWPDAPQGTCPGSIEGNMIEGPDGKLYNFMRLQQSGGAIPKTGKSILYRVNTEDAEAPLEFVSFVETPLACSSKFNLQYDKQSGLYIMLGNETLYPDTWAHQRTVLSMACSKDLINWKLCTRILDYSREDISKVGLQYPDFLFDGDDIITLVRAAINGAHNEHDSNYTLFVTLKDFRKYLKQ